MSVFHEAVKQILADVDKFLTSTLKDENLSKSSQKERNKILECLRKLYEDYEVLKTPSLDDTSSNSSKGVPDESRFTTGSTHSHGSQGSEEDGTVDNIPYTSVKALTEPTKLGWLLKKPTDLLEKFTKQKKYCVIHKNIMYWFKKPADRKQQGAIFLTGYDFKDLTQNDKEFVFELTSNKKKCYQFQADSKEDLEDWKEAVETGIKFVEQVKDDIVIVEEAESGEEYEPIDDVVQAVRNFQAPSNTPTTSAAAKPLPSLPTTPRQAQPLPEEESVFPQDVYAEGFSMPVEVSKVEEKKKTAVVNSPTITTTTTTVNNTSAPEEDDDLIYELVQSPPDQFTTSAVNVPKSLVPDLPPPRPQPPQSAQQPTSPSQGPPPLPTRGSTIQQSPLPPLPSTPTSISACDPPKSPPPPSIPPSRKITPKLDINVTIDDGFSLEEDYENFFYGLFTCVGDSNDELSFDRGDIIHVLNRDLDPDNWWIGESYGKVGFVPKEFLTPVYEVVA